MTFTIAIIKKNKLDINKDTLYFELSHGFIEHKIKDFGQVYFVGGLSLLFLVVDNG